MLSFPSLSEIDVIDKHIKIPDWVKRVKIDVGLSVNAPQACIWLDEDPELFVIGVEPSRSNLMGLLKPESSWQPKLNPVLLDERIIILPYAISSLPNFSSVAFHEIESLPGISNCGMSSLKRLVDPTLIRRISRVQTLQLATIISSIFMDTHYFIDHVKTDCQGADYNVLVSAQDLLKRVVFYTFELDCSTAYVGSENRFQDYHQVLSAFNFIPVTQAIALGLLPDREMVCCDDPTYINISHIDYARGIKHRIFQKG